MITEESLQTIQSKTLTEYLERMQERYFHALNAFYIYESLCELTATNIVGEDEATKNNLFISKHRNFFLPVKNSVHVFFLLELAKLCDSSVESLHIDKIINYTRTNIKYLTVTSLEENHSYEVPLDALVERYKGLNNKDILLVSKLFNEHEMTRQKLRIHRDTCLAHDQRNKPKQPAITVEEIKSLFEVIRKILNTLSNKLTGETWAYSHVESRVKRDTSLVVHYLRRFEPYRLKEIKEKYSKLK